MRLGAEFMPSLDEGTLFYMPVTLPGLSITKSAELLQTQNKIIKSFPEVASVFGKAGRAATATDPAPTRNVRDRHQPQAQDRMAARHDDGQADRRDGPRAAVSRRQQRLDHADQGPHRHAGDRHPHAGRRQAFGPRLCRAGSGRAQVEAAIHAVPGTTSAHAERVTGGYFLDVVPDRGKLAQYGVMIEEVQQAVAIGARRRDRDDHGRRPRALLGERPLSAGFPLRSARHCVRVLVPTVRGGMLPLGQLADVRLTQGATTIRTENAQLAVYVFVDFRDRDLAGYVADARKAVQEKVVFPPGTYAIWSGQFEYLERAEAKLKLVVPATLLLIFVLLYLNFGRIAETLIVMLSLPFALVGGLGSSGGWAST